MDNNIHHTLLDMDDLYRRLSHSQTYYYLMGLRQIKHDVGQTKSWLETKPRTLRNEELLYLSNKTLYYVDRNIYTLENVLRCFETKVYEKRTLFNRFETLWLN